MTVPMDKWQRAQELEAEYHKNDTWRKSPAFMEDTGKLFEFFGFSKWTFWGKPILDVGAGTRARTAWFKGKRLWAIEPMDANLIATDGLDGPEGVIARAAEEFQSDCVNRRHAAVFCINVLDHCYDPRKVVENCIAYLATGGTLCLSTDISDSPDAMHPAVFTEADVESWLVGVKVERKLRGLPDAKAYGRGEAVTWICTK